MFAFFNEEQSVFKYCDTYFTNNLVSNPLRHTIPVSAKRKTLQATDPEKYHPGKYPAEPSDYGPGLAPTFIFKRTATYKKISLWEVSLENILLRAYRKDYFLNVVQVK